MIHWIESSPLVQTAVTLVIGAMGAVLARWLGLPLYQITGPAVMVGLVALSGVRLQLAVPVRDLVFLLVGVGIGAGMNAEAREAMTRWPLAMLALGGMLVAIMVVCQQLLMRGFGFERRAALLASSPGHLSFVIAMSAEIDADVMRITVIQTIRVMAMTLAVPFALALAGADLNRSVPVPQEVMAWGALAMLMLAGAGLGPILKRFRVPAHYLIGGMAVSALAHLVEWTPGAVHPTLALIGFGAIGTLIGTRFSGITLRMLAKTAFAGLSATVVTMGMALAVSVPVAWYLAMPASHVVVAFAPGGLETMIAMGAILGADAGFVAACHLGRLLILPILLPVMLGRSSQSV
ncbi:AbrB family transcriptional regulator [Shimia aestuarii]|uniref:Ammonia monooxygenase n=1 Tax=Shimia aestuarii TaxID=254406 RepID=A0A1I4HN39_9RHOB|nr:AbrB family transcriptional regulator [Shimia aestuarii]SFL42951.1 hypothetical protein SAMN04488042_101160 [Shimia aestuarii]